MDGDHLPLRDPFRGGGRPFPRHRVLACAALAQCTGFVLWTGLPSLGSFAAGFVLWGLSSALTSGTLQSLLYDGLTSDGRSEEYTRVSSRMATVQACSIAVSSVVASPVVLLGGYSAAGWISVVLTLLAVPTALRLGRGRQLVPAPDAPATDGTDTDDLPAQGWLFLLRAGLAEARDTPQVRSCVLMISVLAGVSVVDEYLPVLAKEGALRLPSSRCFCCFPGARWPSGALWDGGCRERGTAHWRVC